jgi:hypothetical protein
MEKRKIFKKDGTKNVKEPGQYLMLDGTPYPHMDFEPFWQMCLELNYYTPAHFVELKEKYKEIKQVIENRGSSLVAARIKYYIEDRRQQRLINLFGYFIQKEHKEKYSKPVSVIEYAKVGHKLQLETKEQLDRIEQNQKNIEKMLEELLKK